MCWKKKHIENERLKKAVETTTGCCAGVWHAGCIAAPVAGVGAACVTCALTADHGREKSPQTSDDEGPQATDDERPQASDEGFQAIDNNNVTLIFSTD